MGRISGLVNKRALTGSGNGVLVVMLLCAAVAQTAWAQAPAPIDLVGQAVEAQGGINALRSLKRLSIKGEVRHWEPEESYVAGGQPVFTDHSTFVMCRDLEHGMARTDWDRAIQFPILLDRRAACSIAVEIGEETSCSCRDPQAADTLRPASADIANQRVSDGNIARYL